MVVTEEMLAAKFAVIFPHLDERQRRLAAGGRGADAGPWRDPAGGPGRRASARSPCRWGRPSWRPGRSRWAGCGGRAAAASGPLTLDPGLVPALLALVEPEERGDPMSPLRWTVKSTRHAGRRS